MKILKTHTEYGMRDAAERHGRKGRSITSGAIGGATRFSGELSQLFLDYVERSMPPLSGRGSRIQFRDVELAYLRLYPFIISAISQAENMLSEEEE